MSAWGGRERYAGPCGADRRIPAGQRPAVRQQAPRLGDAPAGCLRRGSGRRADRGVGPLALGAGVRFERLLPGGGYDAKGDVGGLLYAVPQLGGGSAALFRGIYLAESAEFPADSACLVLSGRYKSDPNASWNDVETTYYRVDFCRDVRDGGGLAPCCATTAICSVSNGCRVRECLPSRKR